MRQAFLLTDANVIDECRKCNDWSGSTVCATLIRHHVLYLANLGDSTAVKFQFAPHSRKITESEILSTQHKPKLEEARIETAGGWVDAEGYILGVLNCSRALGDREMKHYDDFQNSKLKQEFEAGQELRKKLLANPRRQMPPRAPRRKQSIPKSNMKFLVEPTPDIAMFNLEENDALLVIGSDGLWDYLSTPLRYVHLVNEAFSKRQSLEDVCEALVTAAQNAMSSDDITVMVISLQDGR